MLLSRSESDRWGRPPTSRGDTEANRVPSPSGLANLESPGPGGEAFRGLRSVAALRRGSIARGPFPRRPLQASPAPSGRWHLTAGGVRRVFSLNSGPTRRRRAERQCALLTFGASGRVDPLRATGPRRPAGAGERGSPPATDTHRARARGVPTSAARPLHPGCRARRRATAAVSGDARSTPRVRHQAPRRRRSAPRDRGGGRRGGRRRASPPRAEPAPRVRSRAKAPTRRTWRRAPALGSARGGAEEAPALGR